MNFENILLEKKNSIAYVTVNRPKVLNALNMATMEELRAAFHDIKNDAAIRVVILTGAGEKAFIAGADGYLLKENVTKELFGALDAVLRGEGHISSLMSKELKDAWLGLFRNQKIVMPDERLSLREREVLKLVAEGASNKEVAEKLHISARTVDHHRANLMEKLNLKNTSELIRYAISRAYIGD